MSAAVNASPETPTERVCYLLPSDRKIDDIGNLDPTGMCPRKGGNFDFTYEFMYNYGDEGFQNVTWVRDNNAVVPAYTRLKGYGPATGHYYFSAHSQQLIEIGYEANNKRSLYIYTDISQALKPSTYVSDGRPASYVIDRNAPDVLKYSFDYPIGVPAATRDGKHLFVAYEEYGAGRLAEINIATGQVRHFNLPPYSSTSPLKALAVSDDGRSVLVQGGFMFIYDTQACGDPDESGVYSCTSRNVGNLIGDDIVNDSIRLFEAQFNSSGSQLTIYMERATHTTTITLSIAGSGLDYLALGDSFSSGEGDLGRPPSGGTYYKYGTNVDGDKNNGIPREMCHLSERSYPYRLATGMELGEFVTDGTQRWGSVACSGALTADMNGNDSDGHSGQDDGTGKNRARLSGYDQAALKTEALNEMVPGRRKQVDFVKKYQPKVITLTAGGNDVGFADVVRACVNPIAIAGGEWTSTCSYAKDEEKKLYIANEIMGLRSELVSLYYELITAGNPNAKLYILGYPTIVDDQVVKNNYIAENIAACGANVRLNYQERQMVVESTKFLNRVIQSAAREAGAIYISTTDVFGDRKLCGKSSPKAVNGITGLISNSESFHPNELGHTMLANRVWEATDGQSLLNYECKNGAYVTCPDGANHFVQVPEYFRKAVEDDIKSRHDGSISDGVLVQSGKLLIKVANFLYEYNHPLTVWLYSNKTLLGNFTTNNQGGLEQEVVIPADIKPGYHTLEIESNGPDGVPLKLWKVVEVRSDDPNDYDGDGIPNDTDYCTYIEPIGIDADGDDIDDGCDSEIAIIPSGTVRDNIQVVMSPTATPSTFYESGLANSGSIFSAPKQSPSDWDSIRHEALLMDKGVANRKTDSHVWIYGLATLLAIIVSAILLQRRKGNS